MTIRPDATVAEILSSASHTRSAARFPPRNAEEQPQQQAVPTFGYHNTFHSRAQPNLDEPPSYDRSQHDASRRRPSLTRASVALPEYTCTIHMEGVLGMKQELCAPFTPVKYESWEDVYVILSGTSLSIHRLKGPSKFSKTREARAGRLLRQYTLQHAELGIATDHERTVPKPKRLLGHLIPPAAREKVFETDPHLFQPAREYVFRMRPETEQFLLCASSGLELMDWVEAICAAIDISPPIEDRAEPRYRSLPRRNRRQRELEANMVSNIENLSSDADGQRFIEEQTFLLQRLYPHLAGDAIEQAVVSVHRQHGRSNGETQDPEAEDLDAADLEPPSPTSETRPASAGVNEPQHAIFSVGAIAESEQTDDGYFAQPPRARRASTPDEDAYDREDLVRVETPQPPRTAASSSNFANNKPAQRAAPSEGHMLRHRRRCAPILLASSPRSSDIVLYQGRRMRVHAAKGRLVPFEQGPPRYETHKFSTSKAQPLPTLEDIHETTSEDSLPAIALVTENIVSSPIEALVDSPTLPRTAPPIRQILSRGVSESSITWSIGTSDSTTALPALAPSTTSSTSSSSSSTTSAGENDDEDDLIYPAPLLRARSAAVKEPSGFTQGAKGMLVLGMSVNVKELGVADVEREEAAMPIGYAGFVL